jgi:hypothetical protein
MNHLDISFSQILRIEIDWLPIALVFINDVIRVRQYSLQAIFLTKLLILAHLYGRYLIIVMTRNLVIPLVGILVVFLVLTTTYTFA